MTEKRYIKENFYDEYAIKKEDIIIAIVDSGSNARKICNELNALYEENKQLKQRNDRQAKRLAELYELMAKKDWESLTEIIDDFCSCEEQLQRESGTYGEWE